MTLEEIEKKGKAAKRASGEIGQHENLTAEEAVEAIQTRKIAGVPKFEHAILHWRIRYTQDQHDAYLDLTADERRVWVWRHMKPIPKGDLPDGLPATPDGEQFQITLDALVEKMDGA